MKTVYSRRRLIASASSAAFCAVCWSTATMALAQETSPRQLDVVVVTATKKGVVENAQDVPVAVTAFNADQIEAQKIRDLTDLGNRVPNAVLEQVGTFAGVATFSIRGLASTSSIPSVDPTVGVFVDGVYMGVNAGVIFDTFDLESVEVLRGPQGVLFGRNVVGGAVLVNTRAPSETFRSDLEVSLDSGFRGTGANLVVNGTVSGPLSPTVSGKLAAYYNRDDGWFKNLFNGKNFGESDLSVLRGALAWRPNDDIDVILRYEHGQQDGQGSPAQSHPDFLGNPGAGFSRKTHDMALDNEGFDNSQWDQLILSADVQVPFGDGVITGIVGWRDFQQRWNIDFDARPVSTFDSFGGQNQDQISGELRYFGQFGAVDFTTGLYYFQQDIAYQEGRILQRSLRPAPILRNGGGIQDQTTYGAFVNTDWRLTDALTLLAGVRYTFEEKSAQTSALNANSGVCGPVIGPVPCAVQFNLSDDWSNVSHKVGFQYQLSDQALVYANWARGFRAGGFNLRNSNVRDRPGPYDDEQMDSYEVGLKADFGRRARLNVAAFLLEAKDMQRAVLRTEAGALVQTIENTADAEIPGIEVEAQAFLSSTLLAAATLGWMDPKYTRVLSDLNGDRVINGLDTALELPRQAPLTYTFSLRDQRTLWGGGLTSQLIFSHRDKQFASDDNRAILDAQDILDAFIAFEPSHGRWELSVFGKNLTNDVKFFSETQLGPPTGSTFAVMGKGRQIGVSYRRRFN